MSKADMVLVALSIPCHGEAYVRGRWRSAILLWALDNGSIRIRLDTPASGKRYFELDAELVR